MIDAHCHIARNPADRHFLCDPRTAGGEGDRDVVFFGHHPWEFLASASGPGPDLATLLAALDARLAANPRAGVGEIGLDRLKERDISPRMRAAFEGQLRLAVRHRRPVVLHGAKCWGDVVQTIGRVDRDRVIPALLFHGFSRAGGLLPNIVRLNGFVSVGPALLNDHAVNYRELVRAIPEDRLLVESDATADTADSLPPLAAVVAKLAGLRGLSLAACTALLEANARRFLPHGDGC